MTRNAKIAYKARARCFRLLSFLRGMIGPVGDRRGCDGLRSWVTAISVARRCTDG